MSSRIIRVPIPTAASSKLSEWIRILSDQGLLFRESHPVWNVELLINYAPTFKLSVIDSRQSVSNYPWSFVLKLFMAAISKVFYIWFNETFIFRKIVAHVLNYIELYLIPI